MSRILVFGRTVGFRHDSIPAGTSAIQQLADEHGVEVYATDDPADFTQRVLDGVDAVVWMQVSGTGVLNSGQRAVYEDFTQHGGGFAGVHAASDAERDWPLFDQLVGARFASHPPGVHSATVVIEQSEDPSTAHLPTAWDWAEEWYAFDRNPRPRTQVLARVDETSYDPGDSSMGQDHPVAWRTRVGAAQAWYTALGHTAQAFDDADFRSHLWGGVSSVLRHRQGAATSSKEER